MAKKPLGMTEKAIENIPAIILTDAEHKAFTKALKKAQDDFRAQAGKRPLDKQDLWAIYQKVYKSKPTWLQAIDSYFK